MEDHGTPTDVERTLADETLDDHRECMRALARLEDCIDRHPDGEQWLSRIREELPKLAETLKAHFLDEEQGPLYRSVPLSKPRFAERLRRLETEHGEMVDAVRRATRRAEQLDDPEQHEIRNFNAQLQLLVATIRRHEAEENEIVIAVHWDEVGVGD